MIEVTKVGQRDSSYDDFLVDLNVTSENEECGYGLYDLEYMHQCEGTDNPYPVRGLGALCVVFSCMYPGACTRVRLELSAWSRSA